MASFSQMRQFVTVAQELHFQRAADRLGVSQPSISAAVKELETEYNVCLLNRMSTKTFALTDSGAMLYDLFVDLIAAMEKTKRVLSAPAAFTTEHDIRAVPPVHELILMVRSSPVLRPATKRHIELLLRDDAALYLEAPEEDED